MAQIQMARALPSKPGFLQRGFLEILRIYLGYIGIWERNGNYYYIVVGYVLGIYWGYVGVILGEWKENGNYLGLRAFGFQV